MCLIVGELLPQKNWLETSHFCAKTDSRLPSYCGKRMLTAHHVEIWCPPFLFPSLELQDGSVGPHSFSSGKMYTDWARIWPSMAISQSDAFRSILLAYQRQAAATPAGSGLFICLILFCSQYVIISYTQYTLNKVCIGLFVFIPT